MSLRSTAPRNPSHLILGTACLALAWGTAVTSTVAASSPAEAQYADAKCLANAAAPALSMLALNVAFPLPNEDNTPTSEIDWLSSILLNPANEQEVRRGAAERLLAMRDAAARKPLKKVLASEDATLMLAVIEAMRDAPAVDRDVVTAAAEAMRTVPDDALEPLASMLAKHNGEALKAVMALADDVTLTDDERLGPIRALGAFRSRDAAVQLMVLIGEQRGESDAIVKAACDALQHATGLPYGNNRQAWQQWWSEARDQPREEWLTNLVRRLSDQLNAAERKIQEEHQRNKKLESRLAELYRDLFPRFSVEEQLRILPDLLDDPLPAVRTSALDRISRLLRDSVRIPPEVQSGMLTRLDDEEPSIRLHVVRLLDQLNDDETPSRLVERLAEETEITVVGAILEVLARRPAPESSEVLVQWLAEPRQSQRAASALWAYVSREPRKNEKEHDHDALGKRVLETLAEVDDWRDSAAHVRLYGRFAARNDRGSVQALLETDSSELRQAVAEGLIAQGWTQPVLDRASDSIMQPLVLQLMSRQKPTLTGFRQLVALEVEDQFADQWKSAVRKLADAFPADQLLELDEVLSNASRATEAMRAEILGRIEVIGDDSMDLDRRAATLTRLALLRLQLDQPGAALAAMEQVSEELLVSEARRVKFEAAARNGDFDVATSLTDDVDEWISLLNGLVERSPGSAAALHEEIQRRFRDELDDDRRSQLDALAERLEVATDPPVVDGQSPA